MFLMFLFQILINGVCQDFQVVIKLWWEQIGFDVELCYILLVVFFGGDVNSIDMFQCFYVDVEMYVNGFFGIDLQFYLSVYFCDCILLLE